MKAGRAFVAGVIGGALTVLGINSPPRELPWQAHARGLVGHLVLGGVVEGLFDVADAE